MTAPEFVLAAPGYLAVAGTEDLDGALRGAGVDPPRRVLCTAELDAATANALVAQIYGLAAVWGNR
jgi:hypothetical protein